MINKNEYNNLGKDYIEYIIYSEDYYEKCVLNLDVSSATIEVKLNISEIAMKRLLRYLLEDIKTPAQLYYFKGLDRILNIHESFKEGDIISINKELIIS